ncbi:hypothetical protein DOY81_006623, partial [Sarcophaga bullata]
NILYVTEKLKRKTFFTFKTNKMSITGKILLANETTTIFAGQSMEVIIKIENNEKIFLKGIFLNIRGEIKVKWEDLDHKNKHGEIIYFMQQYEGQEICVNHTIDIQNMDVLGKGENTYNVVVNIPQQLPQSVVSKYGWTKYELILGVKHMTGVEEILHVQPLDIKGYLNISKKDKSKQPFRTIYTKSLCWGICNTKPLKVTLVLPTTTFIPGDCVNYYTYVETPSKCLLQLKRLAVILTQTRSYRALSPKLRVKQVHVTLTSTSHNLNRQRFNSRIEGCLKLPDTLAVTTGDKSLIMFDYKLQFIIVLKGFHTDGYITVPITVGSHRDKEVENNGDFNAKEIRLQIDNELKEICV